MVYTRCFRSSIIQKGFTLVELLVVVTLIGILTTVALANFSGGTAKARDTQRKSDLRAIRDALEQYKLDNGSYPVTGTNYESGNSAFPTDGAGTNTGNTQYTTLMTNSTYGLVTLKYMQKTLTDPRNTTPYLYRYATTDASGTSYVLEACLERSDDPQKHQAAAISPCTRANFRFFNP